MHASTPSADFCRHDSAPNVDVLMHEDNDSQHGLVDMQDLGRPSLGSHDGRHMMKNLKPPVFKGEDRDRNKDAVQTFLQKWSDLHVLRHTPESICALETSLSLEGKAYQWWMSLDAQTHPSTWAQFEKIFHKEFLPKNEKDQNWIAWDQCRMEGLTLTQYISKYRSVILKLDGLDDFQKVRGFIRGLDN